MESVVKWYNFRPIRSGEIRSTYKISSVFYLNKIDFSEYIISTGHIFNLWWGRFILHYIREIRFHPKFFVNYIIQKYLTFFIEIISFKGTRCVYTWLDFFHIGADRVQFILFSFKSSQIKDIYREKWFRTVLQLPG